VLFGPDRTDEERWHVEDRCIGNWRFFAEGTLEVLRLRRKFQTEAGLQFAATRGGHD
jgi:hypothetical protein